MDEYAEDLDLPRLPPVVEEYLAKEREWHRLLRVTGAVTTEGSDRALARWIGG